jgi:hypothetical protein
VRADGRRKFGTLRETSRGFKIGRFEPREYFEALIREAIGGEGLGKYDRPLR